MRTPCMLSDCIQSSQVYVAGNHVVDYFELTGNLDVVLIQDGLNYRLFELAYTNGCYVRSPAVLWAVFAYC